MAYNNNIITFFAEQLRRAEEQARQEEQEQGRAQGGSLPNPYKITRELKPDREAIHQYYRYLQALKDDELINILEKSAWKAEFFVKNLMKESNPKEVQQRLSKLAEKLDLTKMLSKQMLEVIQGMIPQDLLNQPKKRKTI